MITRGIVEEIVSPYQVKVRIPLLDRAHDSPLSTSTESLNTATICCLPNCYMNMQVGDVVFVGFEDNTYYKAVILGHLSREVMSNTYSDVNLGTLTVISGADLPQSTTIGNVSSTEISRLSGVTENIQKQIDYLKDQLETLSARIEGVS